MSYKNISIRNKTSIFNNESYKRWRDSKLNCYPTTVEMLIVELHTLSRVTPEEKFKIESICSKTNMAIYTTDTPLKKREEIKIFASVFGLRTPVINPLADTESISSILVVNQRQTTHDVRQNYIPYTNKPLSWHTDGYYNPLHLLVRGLILHCVIPAPVGGASAILDPEILYIRLRDEAPDAVEILSRPDSMLIPANADRPDRAGPVFSCHPQDNSLHMRYTHRTRSIIWHHEAEDAAARLRAILDAGDVPYIFQYRLKAGQGIICNNVLHARAPFHNTPHCQRLFYRARFLERISHSI